MRTSGIPIMLVLLAGSVTTPVMSQDDDVSTSGAMAGALLGAYSGGLASNLGSLIWCTETAWGAGCIRTASLIGAAFGGTAGAMLGDADSDALKRAGIRAAFGFGVGGAFGILSMRAKSAIGWRDAFMLGAIGGAIGAKPFGAALGFGAGTLTGSLAAWVVPGFGLPEIAATAMAGMAVGILADWAVSASNARSNNESVSLSIPLIRLRL